MWSSWVFTPKKKLVVAIVDKTVLTSEGQEHISLHWILNHKRFTKTSEKPYTIDRDYFGFFPLKDEQFEIRGLERFSSSQLKQLSGDADMVYFTDTYGIYNNEWYKKGDINARSGMLYGGLSNKDIELLRLMKERHKLILTEFNTIGSPTNRENRKQFENLFGIQWTGWTGRYFDNLDIEVNTEIPQWLVDNYKKSHNDQWPFTRSGVAFVNDNNEVVILEEGRHLKIALPFIISNNEAQQSLGLTPEMKYPFWFDVMRPDTTINKVRASFKISVNEKGGAELNKYNIPSVFPAVTSHTGKDYDFYYFSGDFSDNPITINSSYFKGIGFFRGFFYDDRQPLERKSFFWNFYRPMLSRILADYAEGNVSN
jgi:hypothetical protein